jgi:hypothetical protein
LSLSNQWNISDFQTVSTEQFALLAAVLDSALVSLSDTGLAHKQKTKIVKIAIAGRVDSLAHGTKHLLLIMAE